jgi:hypothetical protein
LHWAGAKSVPPVDFEVLSEQGIELMAATVEQYMDMPLLQEKYLAFVERKKKGSIKEPF